jgi:cytosine/adenosine deaminase-related metal-dependent hydrolase
VKFIKGDKIFDGRKFMEHGAVLVFDDNDAFIESLPVESVPSEKVQHFKGILTPGFVNAHCHLELSHLYKEIPKNSGLPEFGKHVITLRGKTPLEERIQHMKDADKTMQNLGIVAVGDISNSPESVVAKKASQLFYHTFIEVIGLNPEECFTIFSKGIETKNVFDAGGLSSSIVPHAPYSTSKELINAIAIYDEEHQLPFSIHNQESMEETGFFVGEKSGFNDLYDFLNLDISFFEPPKKSSLQHYLEVLPSTPSLLVHNTCTTAEDYRAAAAKNVFWCFCPSSNTYIENKLPDFTLFKDYPNRICVGTDSLASNTGLDIIKEANLLIQNSTFGIEDALCAITSNPAKALMIDSVYGSFTPGNKTGLNLVELKGRKLRFSQKIL